MAGRNSRGEFNGILVHNQFGGSRCYTSRCHVSRAYQSCWDEVSTRLLRRNRAVFNCMRQTLCGRIPRDLVGTKFKRLRDVCADLLARRLTVSTGFSHPASSTRCRSALAMDERKSFSIRDRLSESPKNSLKVSIVRQVVDERR